MSVGSVLFAGQGDMDKKMTYTDNKKWLLEMYMAMRWVLLMELIMQFVLGKVLEGLLQDTHQRRL